jgi:hypothetical protein
VRHGTSPSSSILALTATRASATDSPVNGPALGFMVPSAFNMLIIGSECRWPTAKSLKSCAGVTFTTPVPNAGSTRIASAMIGMRAAQDRVADRLADEVLVALGSSGCTATAVSPSIVSGRVVATTISPEPSSARIGYAKLQSSVWKSFFVLDLEVRERRLVDRIPVDQPLPAVDEALLPQADEVLGHRALQVVVHREPLARPVARHAQPPELVADGASGDSLSSPHLLEELLAAEGAVVHALLLELARTTHWVAMPA